MEKSDQLKLEVALYALKFVPKKRTMIGIGSGTTVRYFIKGLGDMWNRGEINDIQTVPTSFDSFKLLESYDIPIVSLPSNKLDLTVDGADELTNHGFLLKGGGGALLREKIVRQRSLKFYVIADESKLVSQLGLFPVVIEVLPFAYKGILDVLRQMFSITKAELRMSSSKMGPVITDNGNFLIDAHFTTIKDPIQLENQLNAISGVLENGIFTQKPSQIILGTSKGIKLLL